VNGPDEIRLGFLAQMVHPVVQSDTERAAEIVAELNRLLAPDGWMLRLRSQISGRPVHAPARTGTGTAVAVAFAHDIAVRVDAGYISQQVTPAQQLRGLRDHVTRLRRFARSRSSSSFARSSGGRDASRVTAGSRSGTASSWNAGSNPVWALVQRVDEPIWLIHAMSDVTPMPRTDMR
jgi:hypothetical protein